MAKLGPVEIWLSWQQAEMEIGVRYVRADETTSGATAKSVSMRGAQREITGDMIARGYEPVGRWSAEATDSSGTVECFRNFRPGKDAQVI